MIDPMPLILVCAAWGVFWGSWSALLPLVKADLGTTTAGLGLALTAVPLGAIPAMALTGRLARGRERTALAISTVGFALAVLAIGAVETPFGLGVVLVVIGVTSGALDVALNLTIGRAERESGRRLFQPVHAAFPVAVIAAAPATGLARELGLGLQETLGVIAAVIILSALSLARLPMCDGPVPAAEKTGGGKAWQAALLLGGIAGCALIIENSVEQWSVLLLEHERHAPVLLASTAPAAYMLCLTVGRLAVQAMPRLGMRPLYLLSFVGGGGGIVLAALAPVPWLSIAGFALTGLALGPVVPALLSKAAEGDHRGTMVSAVSTVSYAGFVISPLLVAGLTTAVGLPYAMALLGLFALPLGIRWFREGMPVSKGRT